MPEEVGSGGNGVKLQQLVTISIFLFKRKEKMFCNEKEKLRNIRGGERWWWWWGGEPGYDLKTT